VRAETDPERSKIVVVYWYILLLVPFIAILWVPFYAGAEPYFFGFPYFYWYQFLWILISAVLTAIVYFATREPEGPETGEEDPR
jgi:membrane protein implicated in regulation of membrane protease activity